VELQLYIHILVQLYVNHVKYFSNDMLHEDKLIEILDFLFILFLSFKEALKCDLNGHCEIDINVRRVCPYCRLAKCFRSGMQIEMIRSARSKANKIRQKRKLTPDEIQTTSTALVRLKESEKVRLFHYQSTCPSLNTYLKKYIFTNYLSFFFNM